MPITIRDIAKEASVSHTTVSLVLNRRAGRSIPPATRQRVIDAAANLGYRPNPYARALASGRTNVIEVRGIRLHDPYYVQMLMSLQSILADEGYQVITAPYSASAVDLPVKPSVKWPADGVIAIDEVDLRIESLVSDDASQLAQVSLGAYVSTTTDYVTVDLAAGVTDAMHHLHNQGCRSIAYLADIIDPDNSGQREIAYERAQRSLNLEPTWILCGIATRPAARAALLKYVSDKGVPDAIICRSDSLAIGAMRAMTDLGIHVPGSTLIVGCNGIEEAQFNNPSISTIEIPVDEMCRSAWNLLKQRIDDATPPIQSAVFKARFAIKGSSIRPLDTAKKVS